MQTFGDAVRHLVRREVGTQLTALIGGIAGNSTAPTARKVAKTAVAKTTVAKIPAKKPAHGTYRCGSCGTRFSTAQALGQHKRWHHKKKSA